MKFIKQIIIYYLAFFMIGCGSRPPVSVEEAREMETRVIYGESKEILKASMNVLQDMYYSIDEVNSDMGLLIATKASEGKQAEIRKEKSSADDTPLWKKILVGVFVVTIIGGLMILLGGNNNSHDNDSSNGHHHHSNNTIYSNNSSSGEVFYKYKVTINTSDYGVDETKLRISAVGQKFQGDEVVKSGPIHDPGFYQTFFNKLNMEMGN